MEANEPLVTRVRENALSAAIAAILLSYYGFSVLAEPTGTGAFERAALVFYHTLRIGGVMMALIAVLSIVGVRVALLLDAIASVGIGMLFAVTGIVMFADGGTGLQPLLNVLFGAMFVSSGVRNGRHFRRLRSDAEQSPRSPDSHRETYPSPAVSKPTGDSSTASLAGHLRQHRATQSAQPPKTATTSDSTTKTFGRSLDSFESPLAVDGPSPPASVDSARSFNEPPKPPAQAPREPPSQEPAADSEPAPIDDEDGEDGGFLASFGKQDPPSAP